MTEIQAPAVEYLGKILLSEDSPFLQVCEGIEESKVAEIAASAALISTMFLAAELSSAAQMVKEESSRSKNPSKAAVGSELAHALYSMSLGFMPQNYENGETNESSLILPD